MKHSAIVLVADVLVYGKGLVLMPIVIKTVGADVYGSFSLVTSISGIAFGVAALGVGYRSQRFLPSANTPSERARLFYPQYVFSLFSLCCVSALFALASENIEVAFLGEGQRLSRWAIPAYLLSYVHYSQALRYYRFTHRVGKMAVFNVLFSYSHIGLILLYHFGIGPVDVNSLVYSLAISAALVGGPMFAAVVVEIGARPILYRGAELVDDLRKGLPLVLSTVVDFLLAASDRFLLALFLTLTQVGSYVSAYVLGATIVFVAKAINTVVPQLMSAAQDEGRSADSSLMAAYATKGYLLVAIPFVVGSALLGTMALEVFGDKQVASQAALVVPVVAVGNVLYGLILIQSAFLFIAGRTGAMLRVYAIAATTNVVGNVVLLSLIPSVTVAAVTTVMGYLVGYLYLRRSLGSGLQPVIIDRSTAAGAFGGALVMGVVLGALLYVMESSATWFALLGHAAIGMATYFGALSAFGTLSQKELNFARSALRRTLTRPRQA